MHEGRGRAGGTHREDDGRRHGMDRQRAQGGDRMLQAGPDGRPVQALREGVRGALPSVRPEGQVPLPSDRETSGETLTDRLETFSLPLRVLVFSHSSSLMFSLIVVVYN